MLFLKRICLKLFSPHYIIVTFLITRSRVYLHNIKFKNTLYYFTLCYCYVSCNRFCRIISGLILNLGLIVNTYVYAMHLLSQTHKHKWYATKNRVLSALWPAQFQNN